MRGIIKQMRTIKILIATALLALLIYLLVWAYVILKFVYVWHCDMYTGYQTTEQVQACDRYSSGGIKKVLTNL